MRSFFNSFVCILTVSWSLLFGGTAHAVSYNIFGDTIPLVPTESDNQAVELGVKFVTNGSLQVQGIRFYKGPDNAGTHTAHLWDATGSLLATQNFTNETATGWQTVLFTSPVPVTAGKVYVASYFAPQGHYAADVNELTDGQGLVTDPVYVPANSVTGGSGVYLYAANGGFPSNNYQQSNYYVDVIVAPEGTPPPSPTPTPTPVPTPIPGGPAVALLDATVSGDGVSASTTVTSAGLSTSTGNELLLAFVSADALSEANTTVTGVTGGGLSWSLVKRVNAQSGTSEIWRTLAPTVLNNVPVTASLSQSVVSSITVVSFAGVDTTGTNGSGAIGAVGGASAASGAPSASLVTTRDNSLVLGVGNDFDNAIARSVGPGQSLVHQSLASIGDTYWVQKLDSPVTKAGTGVTINATAPTTDRWNLATVEVLSGNAPPPLQYTITGAVSPPSYGSGTALGLSNGSSTNKTTADSTGSYSFTVLANGSYTVTPSKSGYGFSPANQVAVVRSASVAGVNFTASVAAPANLVIDVAKGQQTIDGMGVNINVNSWKNGQLTPALDALIDTNGSSAFRVIRDPMSWVSSESLIPALHKLDLPTLQSVYETPAMQDLWNTIGYLNKKGIVGKQVILNFMGWTPTWLGGSGAYGQPSHITAGKEPSFATMVASLVYYGRTVKGLNFTYLSPLNEEDWDCKEGPCASASQYAVLMMDLATELNAMGQSDVRFIAPETAGDPSAYIASLQGDTTVFALTDHLTFHAYGGSRSPGRAYASKNYWVTETGAECSSCDYSGTPSQGEWAFASQTNDAVLDDLANGISSVMVYDGYDSFYYHHNAYGFWGLLAYDQTTGLYTPRKRFYVNSQINRFITPGAQMVALSGSVSGLDHTVAFYNPGTQKVTVVGHNTASSPITIVGQINNLPVEVTSMSLYQTNASVNFQSGPPVPVAGGRFQLTVPGDTFFSLTN